MAFELPDGGEDYELSGTDDFSGRGGRCFFKAAYTQLTNSFEQDCYSNICRQGENFMDFTQYEDEGLIKQAHALYHSHKGDRDLDTAASAGITRFETRAGQEIFDATGNLNGVQRGGDKAGG